MHRDARCRPDLLDDRVTVEKPRYREAVVFGSLIAAGLAVFVAPFASPWPDGLDQVARRLGFAQRAVEGSDRMITAPVADYVVPGIQSLGMATAIAGLIGTVLAFCLAMVLARIMIPAKRNDGTAGA